MKDTTSVILMKLDPIIFLFVVLLYLVCSCEMISPSTLVFTNGVFSIARNAVDPIISATSRPSYGCGQLTLQSLMALPTSRGHETNFSRASLQSLMQVKQASKGCRKIHNPAQNPATGQAMKNKRMIQTIA
jgi:hypothetical protein